MRREVYNNLITSAILPALNVALEGACRQMNADAHDDTVDSMDIARDLGATVPSILGTIALSFAALISRSTVESDTAKEGAAAALISAIGMLNHIRIEGEYMTAGADGTLRPTSPPRDTFAPRNRSGIVH